MITHTLPYNRRKTLLAYEFLGSKVMLTLVSYSGKTKPRLYRPGCKLSFQANFCVNFKEMLLF